MQAVDVANTCRMDHSTYLVQQLQIENWQLKLAHRQLYQYFVWNFQTQLYVQQQQQQQYQHQRKQQQRADEHFPRGDTDDFMEANHSKIEDTPERHGQVR